MSPPSHPSHVFQTLWSFAAERHRIYRARLDGQPPPWTDDPALTSHRFTNVFRAADRVTQYLIRHVCYSGPSSAEDIFFRIALFRFFNRIETWEILRAHFGEIAWAHFSSAEAGKVLACEMDGGRAIYSAAYILPPPSLGADRKHENHLRLLEMMMRDGIAHQLRDAVSMQDAFSKIRLYPAMGPFLSYQLTIDVNYSLITSFDEMDFVVPGPGSVRGVRKCFPSASPRQVSRIIEWTTENQAELAASFGRESPTLWGRRMHLIDVQNLYCELDKYSRSVHPDVDGYGRSRMKRSFRPTASLPNPWFPPKWKLNDLVPERV